MCWGKNRTIKSSIEMQVLTNYSKLIVNVFKCNDLRLLQANSGVQLSGEVDMVIAD